MVDPDKKLARPVAPEAGQSEPWNQTDASITHGLNLVWRFVIGCIAALLGGFMIWLVLRSAPASATRGAFLSNEPPSAYFLCAVAGSILIAFAVGQALQIFLVGGDEAFDERLWARLTSRERALWKLRNDRGSLWTFRLWTLLTLATVLYIDGHLGVMLMRLAREGDWVPAALGAVITVAAMILVPIAFNAGSRTQAAPEKAWVSQGRWTIKGYWYWRDRGLFICAISLLVLPIAVYLGFRWTTALWFWFAVSVVLAVIDEMRVDWRHRRWSKPELELLRETDEPLALVGAVTLPLPAEEASRFKWIVRLRAHEVRPRGTRVSFPWLEAAAPIAFDPATGKGGFRLSIGIPRTVPYSYSSWLIDIQASGRHAPRAEFPLPKEIVFPEEYPAQ